MVVPLELCDAMGPNLKVSVGTIVDLCYTCMNLLYYVEIVV